MKKFLALVFLAALAGCATTDQHPSAPPPDADQLVVFFKENSTNLTPEGREIVDRFVAKFHDTNARGITIIGEADGATAHDIDLAAKRARVVADTLTASGIDAARIDIRAGPAPTGERGVAAHKVILRLHPS